MSLIVTITWSERSGAERTADEVTVSLNSETKNDFKSDITYVDKSGILTC